MPATPLADGAFYWRMAAVDAAGRPGLYSPSGSFTIRTVSPAVPAPIPVASDPTNNARPTLAWGAVIGGASYRVEVAQSSSFSAPLLDLTVATTSLVPASALPEGWSRRLQLASYRGLEYTSFGFCLRQTGGSMTTPRVVLASYCLVGLLSASTLLAETISVKVKRIATLSGAFGQMHIYVNNKALGGVTNGQVATFRCDNARIGRNEISVTYDGLTGEIPFWQNINDLTKKNGNRKYFAVRRPDEEIAVEVGWDDRLWSGIKGIFKVSTEVDSDWNFSSVKRVELNRTLKGVIVKESPPIRLAPGTEHVAEESMTIRHEIKTSTSWKVAAEVKAEVDAIWASISLDIMGELESSIRKDYSVETKRTRSVKIIGSSSAVRVVWVKYYRTGTAIVDMNGREVRVPFEVDEDFDLITEAVR
jgi:hypothetical protein